MSGSGRYNSAHYNLGQGALVEPQAFIPFTQTGTNGGDSNALWLRSNGPILSLGANQVVFTKAKMTTGLSDNVAKTIVTPTVAVGQGLGVAITYSVYVTDGTDYQERTGLARASMVNKAGTFTTAVVDTDQIIATSSGTCSVVWGVTAAGLIQVTANTSLTPTSMVLTFRVESLSNSDITLVFAS